MSFQDLPPVRPGPRRGYRVRRCLLKGCERAFVPPRPQSRYCSEVCVRSACRWRRWRASRRYRESESGRACRQAQQERYRQRRRERAAAVACGAADESGTTAAAVLRSRCGLKGKSLTAFNTDYNYLRDRTGLMRYAAYKRLGIPRGSGVTEAACKTVYTQRLKLSGMRWKKAGGQTIVDLRVVLLSGVWDEANERVRKNINNAYVPAYDIPQEIMATNAA